MMLPAAVLVALTLLPPPTAGRTTSASSSAESTIDPAAVSDAAAGVRVGDYTRLRALVAGHSNIPIHEIMFVVYKESIQERNADKKYWLTKLAMYNDMGEKLSGYLDELEDAAGGLAVGSSTSVETRALVSVDEELQVLVPGTHEERTKAQLQAEITRMKRLRTALRKRQAKAVRRARALGISRRNVASAMSLWNRLIAAAQDDGDEDTPATRP